MKTDGHHAETTDLELRQLERQVDRFQAGELSEAHFRAFRVPYGIYEQRERGRYMLRVRLPAGLLESQQMRVLADAALRWADPSLHVTTRQSIQLHRVRLEHVYPALAALRAVGLTTRGAGGNTVRNITVCAGAGVCAEEIFDVRPHAIALGEAMAADPLSYQLPRKYKIALSGCPRDCAAARAHDFGVIACTDARGPGFSAYVGGGLGAHPRLADALSAYLPVDELQAAAEAVKRVFDQHGNRKNKHIARLRFLVERLGSERFGQLYEAELASLRGRPRVPALPAGPAGDRCGSSASEPNTAPASATGEAQWRARAVSAQKQAGTSSVELHLLLGDISAAALSKLATIAELLGDGRVHATQAQNLRLHGIADSELSRLFRLLDASGLAAAPPAILRRAVACAGAATCRLGICLSRSLLTELAAALESSELDLDRLGALDLHVSGCGNSCGRHALAQIGLHGVARRIAGRVVPHYVLQLGAGHTAERIALARGGHAVPARQVPTLVVALLEAFVSSGAADWAAFLGAGGRAVLAALVERHDSVPSFEQDPSSYHDWGATEPFSLAGLGPGECSAGVFDLIELDLQSAQDALAKQDLGRAIVCAARALLVTQGQQADDDRRALRLFQRYFIAAGHIDEQHHGLVEQALVWLGGDAKAAWTARNGTETRVRALVEAVGVLYRSMDASLRFPASASGGEAVPPGPAVPAPNCAETAHLVDFRGVSCPLNYVKTKLALAKLPSGALLSVLLDARGAANVPASAEKDGHQRVSVTATGDHFTVVLRRGA